jgi:hypothetical protein
MNKHLSGTWNLVEKQTYITLRSLVVWNQQCKCSDPRDRIYALLNIMENPLTIRPNYLKSVKQVYQDVVLQSLLQLNDLDILAFCEMQENCSVTVAVFNLGKKLVGQIL